MSGDDERSAGGSRIYRHQARDRGWQAPAETSHRAEAVEAHVQEHIGGVETVWHEIVSDLVHIDVHVVPPTPDRDAYTLFTTGMSDLPMNVPEPDLQYAELLISLPPQWDLSEEGFKSEVNYWPVRLLKFLARMPHEFDTWLGPDHTVPNGDPAVELVPGLGFNGSILFPSVTLGEGFAQVEVGEERVTMLAIYPLYEEEMSFKLARGAAKLFDRLEAAGVTDVVDVGRPNVGKRKKWFGLF